MVSNCILCRLLFRGRDKGDSIQSYAERTYGILYCRQLRAYRVSFLAGPDGGKGGLNRSIHKICGHSLVFTLAQTR
jgi:hypothetical protein